MTASIHAGNLAHLTLLALFPFFIILAAAPSCSGGRRKMSRRSIRSCGLPPSIGTWIQTTAAEVLTLRTGPFSGSGCHRDLDSGQRYRDDPGTCAAPMARITPDPSGNIDLIGVAIIFIAVGMLIAAFSAQVLLTTAEEVITHFVPTAGAVDDRIASSALFRS
ncbi:MAG: hypothetical protein IPI83_13620 [Sphingomonadales bacterium]|nr:hypothetical protein [Sphingomonadales bacterium]